MRWTQGSVCDQATRIEATEGAGEVWIGNDSKPFSEQELLNLCDPMPTLASPERRLRHYGAAFFAAQGEQSVQVEVGSDQNGQSTILTFTDGKPTIRYQSVAQEASGNWIRRTDGRRSWQQRLKATLTSAIDIVGASMAATSVLPLSSKLQRSVRHCPIPFIWNWVPLNRPVHCSGVSLSRNQVLLHCGGEMDGGLYLLGDTSQKGAIPGFPVAGGCSLLWLTEGPNGDLQTLHRTNRFALLRTNLDKNEGLSFDPVSTLPGLQAVCDSGPIPALACLASFQLGGSWNVLELVMDGVCVQKFRFKGLGNLRFAMAASHLDTDLSGFGIIQNEAFHNLIESAHQLYGRWRQECR